ncbi:MAG: aldolase/citrate lyase family protein [Hyphomicrobiaceae bacterium]
MKDKIARGEPALGISLMFPAPQIVEMLSYAGFDWVLLDCEHGSLSLADVELMAMAADASGITAIARPRSNSSADIQSVMDRGVKGVQIPHINTRADAERAVQAVKFAPGSGRGLAAGTRPDKWGLAPVCRISSRRKTRAPSSACRSNTRRRSPTSTTS